MDDIWLPINFHTRPQLPLNSGFLFLCMAGVVDMMHTSVYHSNPSVFFIYGFTGSWLCTSPKTRLGQKVLLFHGQGDLGSVW